MTRAPPHLIRQWLAQLTKSYVTVSLQSASVNVLRKIAMQESFGVPLPESIQFERCEAMADAALSVFLYLRRLAADGEVIYSEDTRVRILSRLKENKEQKEEDRRGTHTSGIVVE